VGISIMRSPLSVSLSVRLSLAAFTQVLRSKEKSENVIKSATRATFNSSAMSLELQKQVDLSPTGYPAFVSWDVP